MDKALLKLIISELKLTHFFPLEIYHTNVPNVKNLFVSIRKYNSLT